MKITGLGMCHLERIFWRAKEVGGGDGSVLDEVEVRFEAVKETPEVTASSTPSPIFFCEFVSNWAY